MEVWEKKCKSNVFTEEVTKELISRNIFSERELIVFPHWGEKFKQNMKFWPSLHFLWIFAFKIKELVTLSSKVCLPWCLPIFRNHSMALGPKWSKHNPVLRASSTVVKGLFLSKSPCNVWHNGHRVLPEQSVKILWTLKENHLEN